MTKENKNETLEARKKAEKVFIPELHSNPELMSYSEKLELAEEIVSEVLWPFFESEGIRGEALDVQGSEIILKLFGAVSLETSSEIKSLVKDETRGVFSVEFVFE